jgi:ribosomal-protein-alanine N-acetyltransferase
MPRAASRDARRLTLRTQRLVLRPLARGDVEMLWPHVSDPGLARWVSWGAHTDRRQTADFLAHTQGMRERGSGQGWAVLEDGAFRGVVGLAPIVRAAGAWRVEQGEIGWWLALDARGRGVATEAARGVLRWAFEEAELHKVTCCVLAPNAPSRRTVRRLGFRFVGRKRAHFHRYERWWDLLLYEMLREEWNPLSAAPEPRTRTASGPDRVTTAAPGTPARATRRRTRRST